MKVIFMGTPAFAAASLDALLNAGHAIPAVVTQPDATSGSVRRTRHSEVRDLAGAAGLQVMQPAKMRDVQFLGAVRALSPEIIVVVAFGRLLPMELISLAPRGAINLHASLLPRHRGASPIPWAILMGDAQTGVTTMQISMEMDAGDILLQRSTPIGEEETSGELEQRLRVIGAKLLVETLEGLREGGIVPRQQDHPASTLAPLMRKQDGCISWSGMATEIARRVRAFDPWPGAWTRGAGGSEEAIRIWKAAVSPRTHHREREGLILSASSEDDAGLVVACGGGSCLLVREVQLAGRRRMAALEALRGRQLKVGDLLGAR